MASETPYIVSCSGTPKHPWAVKNGTTGGIYLFASEAEADFACTVANSAHALGASAAADEVGRLREVCRVLAREVEAWRLVGSEAKSVIGTADSESHLERSHIHALRTLVHRADTIFRAATDASGAMHTPTTGGQGEGGK